MLFCLTIHFHTVCWFCSLICWGDGWFDNGSSGECTGRLANHFVIFHLALAKSGHIKESLAVDDSYIAIGQERIAGEVAVTDLEGQLLTSVHFIPSAQKLFSLEVLFNIGRGALFLLTNSEFLYLAPPVVSDHVLATCQGDRDDHDYTYGIKCLVHFYIIESRIE